MGTLLDELTQNFMRSEAILAVVQEAIDEFNPTLEHVATKVERFGPTFDAIGNDEFQVALGMLSDDSAPAEVDDAPSSMTRDQAQAVLKLRSEALFSAKRTRMLAEQDQRRARETLATAIASWNGSGTAYTQSMLAHDEAQANLAHRLAIAEGRTAPVRKTPRVLQSQIDVEAHYRRGGNGQDFVRKQHRFGSFHRAAKANEADTLHRPGQQGAKVG